MKSIISKAGKAISAIRQDGVVSGGKRVCGALLGMFRKVGSGDILFVTGGAGAGASAFYRCHNQMEELGFHGFKCSFTVEDNPFLTSYADKFRIFIFHRPVYTKGLEKFISKIKENKGEIIFETDDLLFDPKYLKYVDYLQNANALEKKMFEKGMGSEILDDDYVKTCVTSTSFLAEKLRERGKTVFVSRNKLPQEEVELADDLLENVVKKDDGLIRIGYFSGTMSHDKDFSTIDQVIINLLQRYPNLRLVLAGPLNTDRKLQAYENQIERLPFVDRKKHFQNVAQVDINIVPLEDNDFCAAKSEIKFIGAGILEIPTVAFSNQTFKETITDGIDGFLANSPHEWDEKMEKLITDKDFRVEMGKKAREKTLREYTTKSEGNEEYYDYLKSRING